MQTETRILEKLIQSHTRLALKSLDNVTDQDLATLLEELPTLSSTKLLAQMERSRSVRVLELIETSKAATIIVEMPMSFVLILLRLMGEVPRDALMNNVPSDLANIIRKTLAYPKNTAGACLDTRTFTLYQDLTVGEAIERLKSPHHRVYSPVYVLDRDQTLVGKVELKELIAADPSKVVKVIMNANSLIILGNTKISTLTGTEKPPQHLDNLPVVDSQGLFLGLLTKDSLSAIDTHEKPFDHPAIQASSALGELYQIGLSSLFRT